MLNNVLILDFGSQYTQLIARQGARTEHFLRDQTLQQNTGRPLDL